MKRALLSVSDKTGLVEFAGGLCDLGWELVATGGTARALRKAARPVTEVANFTGSPEVLGGRVKTLHPAIHAGLLARDTESDRAEIALLGWQPIDLVAVNLYPFKSAVARPGVTLDQAIEEIDIGGVTLLRAAAKNHSRVTVVCDPADYAGVLAELRETGATSPETRRRLALKAFRRTADYDAAIGDYLAGLDGEAPPLRLKLRPVQTLRYGENPHQSAMLYALDEAQAGPLGGRLVEAQPGSPPKELSYNNLLDLDAAWRAAAAFTEPAVAIVKHLSPCGIACAPEMAEAFRLALASDPISAFGSVIAANRPFDSVTAEALGDLFVECIAAPKFEPAALDILRRRKNLRLVAIPDAGATPEIELRSVRGGVLRQAADPGDPPDAPSWRVVTQRAPTEAEMDALRFAWAACQHVKSNAIVLAQGKATVGIGGGQPNRVDSVRIAGQRAGARAWGSVLASDAFFPFPDGVEAAAELGVTAIVQPGGSVRDGEAIAAADAAGLAMVFTSVRHFRH
jgi:phosphoribosylaminoimidazolecarboxamide formyltransferase/IMP cyclohydrolase